MTLARLFALKTASTLTRGKFYKVRSLLMDGYWRFVNPVRSYRKFITIGQERAGTSYLQTLLNSHEQIVARGEILHLVAKQKKELAEIVNHPIEFIEKKVYKHYPKRVGAVGYKLMYSQMGRDSVFLYPLESAGWAANSKDEREEFSRYMQSNFDLIEVRERFEDFLSYLMRDLDLIVIHAKRRNRLSAFLSLKLASASGAWKSSSGTYSCEPVTLDVNECALYFTETDRLEAKYDALFARHRKVDVIYEDLVTQTDATLDRVLKVLGVEPRPLTSPLKKQNIRSHAEAILNYAELAEHFKGTQFAEFFD